MASALSVLALGVLSATTGCPPANLANCNSNADCMVDGGSSELPVCFNLKCVECRYDSDCKVGHTCNLNLNTCDVITGLGAPPDAGPEPVKPGIDEVNQGGTAWDPDAAPPPKTPKKKK